MVGIAEADMRRVPMADGSYAVLRDGRYLFLECKPPAAGAQPFLAKYLAKDEEWTMYQGRQAVALAFNRLEPSVQREVLLTVFDQDIVDARGWIHIVASSRESLTTLCEWFTGTPANASKVMRENGLSTPNLLQGQQVLFPMALLQGPMRLPTPERKAPTLGDSEDALFDLSISLNLLDTAANELDYGSDKGGPYAVYRLKPGEALYTAVVVRFTDYREPGDVLAACDIVQRRSGIADVTNMKPGQRILIPVDMLADRFRPEGSPERRQYEEVVQEAKRLKGQVRARGLEGVVVVLDPGHGGRDYGAAFVEAGLYEDEINYDIAYRVKHILETTTRAKVYMTLWDPDQGDRPSNNTRFVHDTDEQVLTNPRYFNTPDRETDSTFSANLRWCLANAVYLREKAKGTDPRKMVFTSFHCDALFNERLRGTMIYVPGAALRKDGNCSGPSYAKYQEVREGGRPSSTMSDRRRDEALSRNFAEVVLEELGRKRIKRHQEGDPIRSQIRRSPTNVFVPAVLRNNLIPTKVLIEAANLTNPVDRQRLASPQWRQAFAEAYVAALRRYFDDAGSPTGPDFDGNPPAWAEDDSDRHGPAATATASSAQVPPAPKPPAKPAPKPSSKTPTRKKPTR